VVGDHCSEVAQIWSLTANRDTVASRISHEEGLALSFLRESLTNPVRVQAPSATGLVPRSDFVAIAEHSYEQQDAR
jgi:hypothetical protein